MIEVQHNSHVKIIRSDNGIEFLMPQFYSSKGIIHQTSCVETPEQNGRVESKHQDLLNVGRALLFQANLPKTFWSFAIQHATYLINRLPSTVLQHKSPYELLHGTPFSLENLKVFGSLAYASTLKNNRTKLEPRSRKCIFLGYKQGVKGLLLYDLNTKEIFLSRNVIHHDNILPYTCTTRTPWHYHSSFTIENSADTNPNGNVSVPSSSDLDYINTPPSTTKPTFVPVPEFCCALATASWYCAYEKLAILVSPFVSKFFIIISGWLTTIYYTMYLLEIFTYFITLCRESQNSS
jgi:hypothetical protein